MSYKSMESVMNIFNSREFYKPRARYPKNSIIYSNEVVNDFKRIKRAKTSRQQLAVSMELYSEARTIESLIRREFYNLYKRQEITKGLHRFGKEAVRFYLSMEDGEAPAETPEKDKAAPVSQGKLSALKEGIVRLIRKLITAISSFVRWAQGMISQLLAKKDSIDPAKFDASKFTNMDAEINMPKFKDSVLQDTMNLEKIVSRAGEKFNNIIYKDLKAISIDQIKEAVSDITTKGDVNKFVNQTFYGSDEAPKKEKTTVGKFLNCTAGQKPALLQVCSKQYLDILIMSRKRMEANIKACNKVLSDAKKASNGDETKKIKELQWGISLINNLNVKLFNNALSVRGYVSYAIKKGLSKGKGDGKKEAPKKEEAAPATK